MDANGDDGNDDGSMLAGGVEEQRDEGVVTALIYSCSVATNVNVQTVV